MKNSLIFLFSILVFSLIIIFMLNFSMAEEEKQPSYILEDFGNDMTNQDSVFIFWQEDQSTFDDERALVGYYKFADLSYFGEVYIWAIKDPYVYALGVENKYVKKNFKTGEYTNSSKLTDFSIEDAKIFEKLESRPDLFLKGQYLNNNHRVYTGARGKGELILD